MVSQSPHFKRIFPWNLSLHSEQASTIPFRIQDMNLKAHKKGVPFLPGQHNLNTFRWAGAQSSPNRLRTQIFAAGEISRFQFST